MDDDERRTEKREDEPAPTGFPEPPGEDPGDISGDREPHHSLNNPVDDPDPTEWPDPYEDREDPRAPGREDDEGAGPGDMSSSDPHPEKDPEAGERAEAPERDNLDD